MVERILLTAYDTEVVEVMEYQNDERDGPIALIVTTNPVALMWVRVGHLRAVSNS